MKYKIVEAEKKLSPADIERVEKQLGINLPPEYKDHLLKHNGGTFEEYIVFNFYENGKDSGSDLNHFYAIYDGEFDNFVKTFRIYKVDAYRMPKEIIPIAGDSGGNEICISTGEKDYGYIYFWDHEMEADNFGYSQPYYGNLHFVAESLGEFLDSLKEYVDEEDASASK